MTYLLTLPPSGLAFVGTRRCKQVIATVNGKSSGERRVLSCGYGYYGIGVFGAGGSAELSAILSLARRCCYG